MAKQKYIAVKKCKNCEWGKDYRCPKADYRPQHNDARKKAIDEVKRQGYCEAWMPLREVE